MERCISLRCQRRLPEGGEDEDLSSEEVEVSEVKRGTGLGKVVTRLLQSGQLCCTNPEGPFTL